MYGIGFYDEYLNYMENFDVATLYKINYLKTIIRKDKVYKFISLQENAEVKIQTLKENKIWFSFYKTLNDETEFDIFYDIEKIISQTGCSKAYIKLIINYLTELYDVFSLTYAYEDYMWDKYASSGNGICVEYNIGNYDYLYPVEYCEKCSIDFTNMIINALKSGGIELAIIPWVIKNSYNMTAKIDSSREKEVRVLYCPYDLAEFNGGKLEYNIKERMGYKGIEKSYTDFDMTISKIILGEKCDKYVKNEIFKYGETNNIIIEN